MKVHVVYDGQGNIISVGVPLPPSYDLRGPGFGPEAQQGQHAAELEVPEEHAGLRLIELAERLQVDTRGRQHRLVAKNP